MFIPYCTTIRDTRVCTKFCLFGVLKLEIKEDVRIEYTTLKYRVVHVMILMPKQAFAISLALQINRPRKLLYIHLSIP